MTEPVIKPFQRVLSNSAAEFVEMRAGEAVIVEVVGEDGAGEASKAEFASSLDKFVPARQARYSAYASTRPTQVFKLIFPAT
jgi:hypothetical protein